MHTVTVRSRTRTRIVNGGSYHVYLFNGFLYQIDNVPFKSLDERCDDTVGDFSSANPFLLDRWEAEITPLNGDAPPDPSNIWAGSGFVNYTNYSHQAFTQPDLSSHSISSAASGDDFSALISRTNPSRDVVNPLTLAQDFIDIPKALRNVGKLLRNPKKLLSVREIANQNLAIQFGWIPLVDDVKKILDLQLYAHKRVEELHRLFSKSGLKRRLSLGDSNLTGERHGLTLDSSVAGYYVVDYDWSSTRTRWGTVRWKPTVLPPLYPTTAQINKQAMDIVSGLTLDGMLHGAWDIIPWSFLVDWFSGTGDFLSSFSNTVPAAPQNACIMTKTVTKSVINRNPATSSFLSGGDGLATWSVKRRDVGSASISGHLPFLSANRLSILGSLAIQRLRR